MQWVTEHADGSFRACNAIILGAVTIGRQSSFWFNVIVRGDVAPIVIGQRVNVQDAAIIHCESGVTNIIEDDVSIAHGAIVHGRRVGRSSLIGIGAKVLGDTEVGQECIVAAGAVVPPRMVVPDRHLVAGIPARVVRPLTEKDLGYLKYVTARYVELSRRYATEGEVRP